MSVTNPVKVPIKEITSVDIPDFTSGLFLNGAQNAPLNSFIDGKDVELSIDGYIQNRRNLTHFLPDTIDEVFQIFPVYWQGVIYYFTLDHGQVVFCQEGDEDWTACDSVGVAASYTTALTGANNDLVYTSTELGSGGDTTTIAYINAGASKSLAVSVSGTAISVQLATNSSSVITSTAAQVLAAIQASTTASALVTVANASGNTGVGVVTALSVQSLAGGSGTNIVTTGQGGFPVMLRVLDSVLCLNGGNGDKLFYVDLTTTGFPVVHYTLLADPGAAMTAALTGLTTGSFDVYYAYSYDGPVGETLLSPILTESINIVRDQWVPGTNQITLTKPGTAPVGATFWNLYIAVAATAGSIQDSDMLTLATKLPLTQTTFLDDGTLSINLGSIAPSANSTDGPRVTHGIVENGNPILFGDVDNPYNIAIGGGGPFALDFSISNGGYTAQPEQGTNFFPTTVVGFRNGQGIPSLTVLYSNTEGLSKQATLEQQTVTYGDTSFSVWGVTEQHYGSAGVAAPNSAVNYNGKLAFLSTDGFVTLDTQTNRLNVIASTNISSLALGNYVKTIKTSAMESVVGAGWNDKFMWLVPSNGFDTPQQILVWDNSNNKTAFYILDIPAQWIGVVTPQEAAAFVYVVQGKSSYKLLDGKSTYDTKDGVSAPFSTSATGPLVGMGGNAHNVWQADVQTVFYVLGLIGEITVGVNYRNQNGTLKTKTKTFQGPSFTPSAAGGWGDPGWNYGSLPGPAWSSEPVINQSNIAVQASDVRIPIQIDDITNEAQWFFSTPVGYQAFKLRAVSFEGINLGVRPDLQ